MHRRAFLATTSLVLAAPAAAAAQFASTSDALQLRFVADEADAVLRILDDRARGTVPDADWAVLFASEGYRRLVARETAMHRPIDETTFRAFVLDDALLARRDRLRATVASWSGVDVGLCGRRALAYLPAGSRMHAAVYAEIKPQHNSFVFDLEHDPGIFLYVDPDMAPVQFTYTVAHELHHVGFAQNCPTPQVAAQIEALPPRLALFETWLGGFGEGFAVLAGAGGPSVDPATVVGAAAAPEWRTERASFAPRQAQLVTFFRGILAGTLDDDAAQTAGLTFFGNQGPWYTVGWRMAVTIEQRIGRDELIACIADNRRFLPTFNRAANGTGLSTWPDDLANAFG